MKENSLLRTGELSSPFLGTFPVSQALMTCHSSHQSPKNSSVPKQGDVGDVALAGAYL